MRYVAMQVLTWGTIAGSIGSALLLAALDSPAPRYSIAWPIVDSLSSQPAQADRVRPESPAKEAAIAGSAPRYGKR
jgi:hypothetical protein